MAITSFLNDVCQKLHQGQFISEENVKQGIVERMLFELGWDVFDTSIVAREFVVEGRRVDYALFHPPKKPLIFIEVKKVGASSGADRQLFEYAFHQGVPMAILTDGREWSFYLPAQQGHYNERRVYKLDLLERSIEEAEYRLKRYLGYDNICSGQSLENAKSDYQDAAKNREIQINLPKAWKALLGEKDSLLIDLLAEKVEDLCGYRPNSEACVSFLETQVHPVIELNTRKVVSSSINQNALKTQSTNPNNSKILLSTENASQQENITKRTNRSFMDDIYKKIIKSIELFFGYVLIQKERKFYSTNDEKVGFYLIFSKAYKEKLGLKYWFAFHPKEEIFLEKFKESYFVYACGSASDVFIIPLSVIKAQKPNLPWSQGQGGYWHIHFHQRDTGFHWTVSRESPKVDIEKYRLKVFY
jgi:hypothetical protein